MEQDTSLSAGMGQTAADGGIPSLLQSTVTSSAALHVTSWAAWIDEFDRDLTCAPRMSVWQGERSVELRRPRENIDDVPNTHSCDGVGRLETRVAPTHYIIWQR